MKSRQGRRSDNERKSYESRNRDRYTQGSRYADEYRRYDDRDDNNSFDRNDQRPRNTNNPYRGHQRQIPHQGSSRRNQGLRYKSWTDDDNAYKAENYDSRAGNWNDGNDYEADAYVREHGRATSETYGVGENQDDQYYGRNSQRSDRKGQRGYGTTNYNDGGDTYENYKNQNRYSQSNYRERQYRDAGKQNRKRSNDQSHSAGYF